MIPKKLHQVWLGDKDIPRKFIEFTNNWRDLHPDWDYKLWTDETISDKPEIKNLVDQCGAFSSKSNVVRLYAVYLEGGVYADMDVDWVQNFNKLLNVNAFAAREQKHLFCNALFGAISNSEWVKCQIEELPELVHLPPPWGPPLMTRASDSFKQTEQFNEYPKNYFYPFLWNQKAGDKCEYKNSYAIHYWAFSWKTYKMIKACDELFDFKYLVKWDVSTLDDNRCYRKLMHNGYDDRFSSCLSFLQNFIMNKQKDIDYHSHLKNKNDAGGLKIFMTRRKKVDRLLESNRDLNTEKLFSDKVHYYSGKFYILSSRFAHFIATDKKISHLFNLAHQHGCGVEDMTIGHAYKLFQSDKEL